MRCLGKIILLVAIIIFTFSCMQIEHSKDDEPIIRYDRPESSILKGVHIPDGKAIYFTSGLVADVRDEDASTESYERYGSTYDQSISTLKKIRATLAEAGFAMGDVFYLRVYLAPDAEGVIHWQDWFDAYSEFFNNEANPNKVARTTLGVHSLARPDLLVEIEAVAAK